MDIAKFVIETEASALLKLGSDLPKDFFANNRSNIEYQGKRLSCQVLENPDMLAEKLRRHLLSTGTPASFVHATEASHGDLGMITADDFCLLISNSGETSELNDILSTH